jgi:Xaa-Pro aminopeptidase
MHEHLQSVLKTGARVAMEYSPLNAIPYVGRVDAGAVELVRSFGAEVVTSANIALKFTAVLTPEQQETHREAGRRLIAAKDALLLQLGDDLRAGKALDEYSVQQCFVELIHEQGLVGEDRPMVSVNGNASNPHYTTTAESSAPIRQGDTLLLDFWAHLPVPGAIYGDYTWMCFVGTKAEIPPKVREVFDVVLKARDAGIDYIRQLLQTGEAVEGRWVDDVVRKVIVDAGYGPYFVHRTGHNIGTSDHGDGANLDNFETRDARLLLPGTCNSIEPGIYLPEFGLRTEVDLLIYERDLEVTGVPRQTELTPLLS